MEQAGDRKNIIYQATRRKTLRLAGICLSCGKSPSVVDKIYCPVCARRILDARKKKGDVARAQRKCLACDKPPEKGFSNCSEHRKIFHQPTYDKLKRERRKASGECIQCGTQIQGSITNKCQACMEYGRVSSRESYRNLRLKVLAIYGSKCVCCGEMEPNFLTLDHKDNDGHLHRNAVRAGSALYKQVLKMRPTNIQVLCYNCNCAKGHYGVCPHQVVSGAEVMPEKRPRSLITFNPYQETNRGETGCEKFTN